MGIGKTMKMEKISHTTWPLRGRRHGFPKDMVFQKYKLLLLYDSFGGVLGQDQNIPHSGGVATLNPDSLETNRNL
jgi:hypothetical protein